MKTLARTLATLTLSTLALAQMQDSKPDTTPTKHPIPSIQDKETPAQRDARMAWWREARFGMFIHWGLYSIPAGTWQGKQIPSIAALAKSSGMNDIIITSKHHGGFAMFDSEAGPFNIVAATPFHRDPLREL